MTVKTILTKTLQVLDRDGWAQGCNTSSAGGHCVVDAIWRGFKESAKDEGLDPFVFGFDWSLRYTAELRVRSNLPPNNDWTLVHWNDNPKRTYQEVRQVLEAAVKYS